MRLRRTIEIRNSDSNQSSAVLLWSFHSTTVNDHHFVDFRFGLPKFQSLVCHDSSGVHIKVEKPDASNIAAVASVATKACTTTVAHPQRRLLVLVFIQHAIVIDVITKKDVSQAILLQAHAG